MQLLALAEQVDARKHVSDLGTSNADMSGWGRPARYLRCFIVATRLKIT